MNAANAILSEMQVKVDRLEKENTELEKSITKVEDPFERERIIRDELLMQKPGEIVVQVPKPSPTVDIGQEKVESKSKEGSWFDRLKINLSSIMSRLGLFKQN